MFCLALNTKLKTLVEIVPLKPMNEIITDADWLDEEDSICFLPWQRHMKDSQISATGGLSWNSTRPYLWDPGRRIRVAGNTRPGQYSSMNKDHYQ